MQPLPLLASSLYCAEDADDVASWDAVDAWGFPPSPTPLTLPRVVIFPPSLYDPDRPISDLFATELEHMPRADYIARFRDGSLDCAARVNAINWILKVIGFYRFRPVTASLSINYLDRFLSSQTLPVRNRVHLWGFMGAANRSARATQKGMGWPWQLLSVACLSVAAKMEETHVPLLVDLQILEPRFVFEPRTVRRMELLLMTALQWRMRSVTPFDFVDHFAGLLHADCPGGEGYEPLFCRASDLILGTHSVVEFLGYRPSEVAAAAVLCASREGVETCSGFYDVISKETVSRCRQQMDVYLMDTCRKGTPGLQPPTPPSPAGVLDAAACGSCDTQKSSSATAPNTEPPAAEPPAKRRRLSAAAATCTEDSKGTSHEDGKGL